MRKITRLIVIPMNFLGLNPLKTDTFFNCYARLLFHLVTLVYGMQGSILYTYHASNDFYNFVVPVAYAFGMFLILLSIMILQKYKPYIRDVLSSVDDNVFTYPDEDGLRPEYGKYLLEENYQKLWALILSILAFGFTMSLLSPFIGYFFVGRVHTYAYPQWIQWNVDTTLEYVVTYILQLFVVLTVASIYFSIQIYFAFILVEFLKQFKKLQYALETLDRRSRIAAESSTNSVNLGPSQFDLVFKFNLITCIRHHKKLYELFKTFRIVYQILYSLDLIKVTFTFSLVLFCLVEEHDPERTFSLLGIAWDTVSNILFKCIIGEEFSEMVLFKLTWR